MLDSDGPLSAPFSVDLLVTSKCNLRCLHCSASPEQFTRGDMTTAEILSLIDELAACKVFKIALTGGEPLLHPDFFAFAEAVVGHPMRLQINTNATLATPQIASRLRSLKRPPFISVSLDGVSAGTHDPIRGLGSFEKVIAGIRTLAGAGLQIRPLMVVSRMNVHEVESAVDLTKQLGLKSIFLSTPLSCARAACYTREMRLDDGEWAQLLRRVRALDKANPGLIDGPIVKLLRVYDQLESAEPGFDRDGGVFRNCGAARNCLAIGPDGTVSPCQMIFALQSGNVRDSSFLDIWRNSPQLADIRKARKRPVREIFGCEDCELAHLCTGPCPVEGFLNTGVWPAAGTICLRSIDKWSNRRVSSACRQEVRS